MHVINCDQNIVYELSNSPSFEIFIKCTSLGFSQFNGSWNPDLDTGTRFIFVLIDIALSFKNEISATYDTKIDGHIVDCNIKFNITLTV